MPCVRTGRMPSFGHAVASSQGRDDDVRGLVSRVAGYMGVGSELDVEFRDDLDHARELSRLIPGGTSRVSGAAGVYTGPPKAAGPSWLSTGPVSATRPRCLR